MDILAALADPATRDDFFRLVVAESLTYANRSGIELNLVPSSAKTYPSMWFDLADESRDPGQPGGEEDTRTHDGIQEFFVLVDCETMIDTEEVGRLNRELARVRELVDLSVHLYRPRHAFKQTADPRDPTSRTLYTVVIERIMLRAQSKGHNSKTGRASLRLGGTIEFKQLWS